MLSLFLLIFFAYINPSYPRTFTIDYQNDCFLKDGQPFRYISGALHYFRVPRPLWEDRLYKYKIAGLNAIQTYIYWARHEPELGQYNFEDQNDIFTFFKMAADYGFVVVLRPSPYIDAEVDMGGLPYWLLRENPHMQLRTNDTSYLKYVDNWFNYLLPRLKPYLYENGGPIISVQVENEYGSYWACDRSYTTHLKTLLQEHLGPNVLFFTTDGGADSFLVCGKVEGVYATVDFGAGSDVSSAFAAQRKVEPHGPLVNSEFYPGWIDHYGHPHSTTPKDVVVKTLREILNLNASVTIYLFGGGTDFGFQKGANELPEYGPAPVSYDFDAPISESGDLTPKYFAVRDLIGEYNPLPPDPVPPNPPKYAYGKVIMEKSCNIFDLMSSEDYEALNVKYPISFEAFSQAYGFILYETVVEKLYPDPAQLYIPNLHDRAYVFVNYKFAGILDRTKSIYKVGIIIQPGQALDILVENQGRVCYGPNINDSKGIYHIVTLENDTLFNWTMFSLPFNSTFNQIVLKNINSNKASNKTPASESFHQVPSIYSGAFVVPNKEGFPQDTFLRMDNWSKGVVILNGFNIGRYWPIQGPQVTLFIPKHLLKPYPENNILLMFELENAPCDTGSQCVVEFTDKAVLNGTTPDSTLKVSIKP